MYIKKYNNYIKEEIKWKNLNPFKKNKYYPEYNGNELDPYGEEDWDDKNSLVKIIRNLCKPYDDIIVLSCYHQELTSLEGIENLNNLSHLYCHSNNLTNLDGIENLNNLKDLYCYQNQLTNIDNNIENLYNLEELSCFRNQLTNLNVKSLVNLKELLCFNNRLTSIEGIENLPNLRRLYCFGNRFSSEYTTYLRKYCKDKNISMI